MVIISQFAQFPLMSSSQLKFIFFPWWHQHIISLYMEKYVTWLKSSILLCSPTLKGMSLVSFFYELGMSGISSVLLVCLFLINPAKLNADIYIRIINIVLLIFILLWISKFFLSALGKLGHIISMQVLFHLSEQVQ